MPLETVDVNPLEAMRKAAPASESTALPEIGSIVYYGLAGRFVDLLQQSTEAPREFRLAAFLTVVGALIGRRAWVTYSRPTYPNFYTLLVGQTASSRKTTVTSFALDVMNEVSALITGKVKMLYGLASIEGLAAAMHPPCQH